MMLTLTGPVVLDLGRGVKLRVEPIVDEAGPAAPRPAPIDGAMAVREKMAELTAFGSSVPAHWNEPPSGGSPDVQWFRSAWCEPQGHMHTTITETGCMIQALAALRGEDPALRERLLAAGMPRAPPAGRESPRGERKARVPPASVRGSRQPPPQG